MRGTGTVEGVFGIVLKTIEEMFTIEHRLPPLVTGGSHGFPDHVQVFFKRDAQRSGDVEIPCLADQTRSIGFSIKDSIQPGIV